MPITPPLRGDREEHVAWELPERWVLEVSKLSHARILRYETCLYALVEDFNGRWWYVEDDDCFQTPAREVRGLGDLGVHPQIVGERWESSGGRQDPALQQTSWDLTDTWKWGRDTGEFQTGVNS